jgi:proton-dependent oligopeptide transporter, POT family
MTEQAARMPSGVPYIVVNEAAERFSYYGMRAILVVFMTQYLRGATGQLEPMGEVEARFYYHLFTASAYFFPVFGGIVADAWWGKYRTIIRLSLGYCLGHLALSLDETRLGLFTGLALIALGAGGIKSCVSAHVGDQFGPHNQALLSRVFNWFYWAINLGAFASQLSLPVLLDRFGSSVAFAVPGVLMAVAALVFWLGRRRFVHIPPTGIRFLRETLSPEGRAALGRLISVYLFVALFWSLFDQTGSAWVLQAQKMDLDFLGVRWFFIPLFSYGLYPALARRVPWRPQHRIASGLFVTVLSFLVTGYVEWRIGLGEQPSIAWHLLAYACITAAEVLVSITALELSYTQAPPKMKSLVMGVFWLSVWLGNVFTALVNLAIEDASGNSRLPGASYYLFFAAVMFVGACAFVPLARRFREQAYLQTAPA